MVQAPARLPDGPFTLHDAARLGVNARTLQRLASAGQVARIAHGLYQRPETATYDTDLYAAARRHPLATLCLTSALAHHGLTDTIPARTDLALPRGTHRPAAGSTIRWHVFDADAFTIGRDTTTPVEGTDASVGLYSAERCLVDAFRLRNEVGYEIGVEALRTWLRRRGSTPAALLNIANALPRAQGPLREALRYLT